MVQCIMCICPPGKGTDISGLPRPQGACRVPHAFQQHHLHHPHGAQLRQDRYSQPECPQQIQLVSLASWYSLQLGLVGQRRMTVRSKVRIPHILFCAGRMTVLERPHPCEHWQLDKSPRVKAVVRSYMLPGHRWEMHPGLVGRQWGSGLSASALRHCRGFSVGSQCVACNQNGQK